MTNDDGRKPEGDGLLFLDGRRRASVTLRGKPR
jgi:hypothetical protein